MGTDPLYETSIAEDMARDRVAEARDRWLKYRDKGVASLAAYLHAAWIGSAFLVLLQVVDSVTDGAAHEWLPLPPLFAGVVVGATVYTVWREWVGRGLRAEWKRLEARLGPEIDRIRREGS